jgi:F0F1-type ATP synthase membrane subunit b/b'
MNPEIGTVLLTLLIVVFLAAVYWTVFKIRADLNESQERIRAELSEIRKLLESKTGKE